ncbi:MAG: hypothetical protein ACOCZ7_02860 [Armatimonadota bacterium]
MRENERDIDIIRELAVQYAEIAAQPIMDERRDLWRRHNSLKRTRPLVYMRWFAAWQEHPQSQLQCEDPFWQAHERFLRQHIVQDEIADDYVIEPWITQSATKVLPDHGRWGVPYNRIRPKEPGGAWLYDPPVKKLEDIEKLAEPHHVIDEDATARNIERLRSAVGDILTVNVDRTPAYWGFAGDISTDIAYIRGLEQLMWDMADNPEWLHRLLSHMRDGILRVHEEAEAAGDLSLTSHINQAQPYSAELPDPAPNSAPVKRKDLWMFCAAQEFAQISPAMHDEFMYQYQMDFLKPFGLVAYGCCEDLTNKMDMLRQLPNLRRIAVVPRADVAKSAELIGTDYVFSWRPNPADVMCCGFDREKIRRIIREGMEASKGCHVDITLKDVQTIEHEPWRLREWVQIVREITDEYA